MEFLVAKDDFQKTRFEAGTDPPEPADGEAVLAIDRFGLTSNNVTYVVFGEAMNYWDFFPGPDGWGRPPVWGFAEVAASKAEGVEAGTRLYGYLPAASHLVTQPAGADERGFHDGAPHRAELPSAYQGYRAVAADPAYAAEREDEQVIFWPLFYTSFLIDDFLADSELFGADTAVLSSASSKTAIIAAYLLAQREGIELVGLTSASNAEFVEGLGIYDAVTGYDGLDSLSGERAVYVDFSGSGEVRANIHEHYGDRLAHSAVVGATHHDKLAAGAADDLAGPKPKFFFAPDRIRRRGSDWGTAELERRVTESWHPFAEWAGDWLRVEEIGADRIEPTYLDLLDGKVDPKVGHVVSLAS